MLIPGWRHLYSGKVRDLFVPDVSDLPDDVAGAGIVDAVLVVASDRVSAFDHVLTPDIPGKGEVLTALSRWWFARIEDIVPSHLLSGEQASSLPAVPSPLAARSMLCRRLEMFPVECVVRGYLTGSGLAEYRESGSVAGIELPHGLMDGSRLPEPIFTPARKAELGEHDENVTFDQMVEMIGADDARRLRELSLAVYARAERIARERGLILADTKFEFGRDPSSRRIVLGDEALTPDSSRYWSLERWEPGGPQPSFDKQPVRDWLAGPENGWNPSSDEAPPRLPDSVVQATSARYRDALDRLTAPESR